LIFEEDEIFAENQFKTKSVSCEVSSVCFFSKWF